MIRWSYSQRRSLDRLYYLDIMSYIKESDAKGLGKTIIFYNDTFNFCNEEELKIIWEFGGLDV